MRANTATTIIIVLGIITTTCSVKLASAAAPSLFKHVDANGKVTYTDVPLSLEEKQLAISNTARNGNVPTAGNGRQRANAKRESSEADQAPKARAGGHGKRHGSPEGESRG